MRLYHSLSSLVHLRHNGEISHSNDFLCQAQSFQCGIRLTGARGAKKRGTHCRTPKTRFNLFFFNCLQPLATKCDFGRVTVTGTKVQYQYKRIIIKYLTSKIQQKSLLKSNPPQPPSGADEQWQLVGAGCPRPGSPRSVLCFVGWISLVLAPGIALPLTC
jgi:hypothetical protein